ncbi:hypothetical protein C0993_012047 [Termitomyces sp. T159_Od127]|nr:hypothetical protein C0993_012047 [Termitomyces sp. T159_Od127]
MSARTPFVPISRPSPRISQEEAQTTADPVFTVDPDSPLNVSAMSKAQLEAPSQADTTKDVSLGGEARPLNTSSLLKGRNSQSGQNQNSMRRPFQFASEKTAIRPGTADPRSKAIQEINRSNSLNIIAPVPRQAPPRPSSPSLSTSLASGIFASGTPQPIFRLPNLPHSTPNDIQSKHDAHITNSTLGFSFSNPHASLDTEKSQLPSPPDSLRLRNVRNYAATDPEIPPPPFTLNFSNSNQTGPQRVLLNPDGSRGPPVDHASVPDNNIQLTTNRSKASLLKRPYPNSEPDSEHQTNMNDFKRYRKEDDGYNQNAKSVASHVSSPSTISINSHTPDHFSRSAHEHSHQPTGPVDGNSNYFMMNDSAGLSRLLGYEVDAYVEQHIEQYERAVERWKGCTMEEWIAGADEQTARYTKILDFASVLALTSPTGTDYIMTLVCQ